MKNNNSVSVYIESLYKDAQYYNRSNTDKAWAQASTVKGRAINLANIHLSACEKAKDLIGIEYARAALKRFRAL